MSSDLLREADRVMAICNACRYCEGFCAVFPAMELRRKFTENDLKYLANLCHNCRDCYYACQYAPPHPFELNFPKTMAMLRFLTYRESARPSFLARFFERNGIRVALVTFISTLFFFLIGMFAGEKGIFSTYLGKGSFYEVIPYSFMVVSFIAAALFAVAGLARTTAKFWKDMGGTSEEWRDIRAHLNALLDALSLTYLGGGGYGCNYPDEGFSMIRRYLHHALFYGFLLCLAATTVAAVYDHILGVEAPYPFLSLPVALGTAGGMGMVTGSLGLLFLKTKMDRIPATEEFLGMDIALLCMLFFISFTGLLLLLFRSTPAMGMILLLHLGGVMGLFLTMPCGKFVHTTLRYAALVKNAKEQKEA